MVRQAADLAVQLRWQGVVPERKSSAADLVTTADRAAEKLIQNVLYVERPGDGVIGEEGSLLETLNGRTWVADPIDGTFNFVSGLSAWCSAVALEYGEELVASAVHRPALGETWVANPDQTWINGSAVPNLVDTRLRDSSVATYLNADDLVDQTLTTVLSPIISAAATVRISGSGTCDLADTAAGRIGLWIQADCPVWDWLPGRGLVEGAGGATAVLEHLGRRWHIAGSRSAVDEASELLTNVRL